MSDWSELEEHLRTRPTPSTRCMGVLAYAPLLDFSSDPENCRAFAEAALEWVRVPEL